MALIAPLMSMETARLRGALADEQFVNVPAAPVSEWAQHLALKLCFTLGAVCAVLYAFASAVCDARAQAAGVTCVPLLVETFGGLSPALMHELRAAAEWRSNKLTSSEYDETTWSARTWLTFVAQRLSVAVQLSVAQEAAEALGLSVAADPRAR